ncbi:hypothetical protein [Microbispora sp. NPDC046933]|uniref:hypothetical protein n=1 Tax=Microbispora sp. NPDC046933 TaxID=3155618 RepID=UPI0033FBDDD6
MRRLALVSGLSVLLAVGVTTGGARLIAGRTSLAMEKPTTACPTSENCAAAGAPNGAPGSGEALGGTPAPSDPTGDPSGDPARNGQDQSGREDSGQTGAGQSEGRNKGQGDTAQGDTAQDRSAAPRPTSGPTATSGGPDRDHASARTRTRGPSSTPAPRASAQASAQVGDAPVAVTAAPGGTADTMPGGDAASGDAGNTEDTARTDAAGGATTGVTTGVTTGADTARTESAPAAGGPEVRVRFTVTHRDESGYAARIAVRNEGPALPSWTIRLAVGGQVTAVEGADWRQQGSTLVLSAENSLDEGGTLTLAIHADGASAAPADCVLSEGRCEVTGPGPSRRRS